MNKKIIQKTKLLLLFSVCFISGCDNKPIEKFLEHHVALASGVDFDSHKLVLLDAETGKEVPACNPSVDSEHEYRSNTGKASNMENNTQKCNSQFVVSDTNSALNTAIELSKKPIQGEIKKNGKAIPATYFVTVTALYKGFHCNTTGTGGSGGETCGRTR